MVAIEDDVATEPRGDVDEPTRGRTDVDMAKRYRLSTVGGLAVIEGYLVGEFPDEYRILLDVSEDGASGSVVAIPARLVAKAEIIEEVK